MPRRMIYGSPYPIYSYLHHEISLRALRHCLFITYGEKCYARMAEILSPLIVARDTTTHPPPPLSHSFPYIVRFSRSGDTERATDKILC
jgi:hypothetical protein